MTTSSSPPPPPSMAPGQPPPLQAIPLTAATAATVATASRRLPPPCWSYDETVALIDAYRDKWYSLRRGNLKASHWQDVADAVARRCPHASPPKTSVQCRHKMEKLRKRYRSELQRTLAASGAAPNRSRVASAWVHFKRMHTMEKGPAADDDDSCSDAPDDDDDNDNNNNGNYANYVNDMEDDGLDEDVIKHGFAYNWSVNSMMNNGIGGTGGGRGGFRIKYPGGPSNVAGPGTGFRTGSHENPNLNPSFGSRVVRDFVTGMRSSGKNGVKREADGDAVAEMVAAIKVLGDGFVRMEQMKMEMAREIEAMRMEMEMKRTEMILESQQRIVEAFAKGFQEK